MIFIAFSAFHAYFQNISYRIDKINHLISHLFMLFVYLCLFY